jgi:hypothetical protein
MFGEAQVRETIADLLVALFESGDTSVFEDRRGRWRDRSLHSVRTPTRWPTRPWPVSSAEFAGMMQQLS